MNILQKCPTGVDPKDWMPLYGCTRQEWRKAISVAAKKWRNSLPEKKRREWDHAYDEALGLSPVEDPE